MSDRLRFCLFIPAVAGFAAMFLWGLDGLARFGNYPGPYGDIINRVAVPERHLTNMATAVNFDYRGFDTLGEEYILFAAVVGLALLLRQARGEIEQEPKPFAPGRVIPAQGDAIQWLALSLTGGTVLFGIYVVAHCHLTPGGGFQGGAILGTVPLLMYLTVGFREFRAISPRVMLETAEAAGAGSYALVGFATLLASGVFLMNCLPLGKTGNLFSAGMIPIINVAVGLEVAGGFLLMFVEFLKDTRKPSQAPHQ